MTEELKATEEQLIEVYDHLGHDYFGELSDQKLKEWGWEDELIRKQKTDCVKSILHLDREGIQIYKLLNEKCGGKNAL